MTLVYSDAVKTARLQAVSDAVANRTLGVATGPATQGKLVIGAMNLSGTTGVLVTFDLPATPFVVSGSGTVFATLQGVPLTNSATGGGIATKAEIRKNDNVTVVVGGLSAGTINTDIILTNATLLPGQPVTVVSGTIVHG